MAETWWGWVIADHEYEGAVKGNWGPKVKFFKSFKNGSEFVLGTVERVRPCFGIWPRSDACEAINAIRCDKAMRCDKLMH